MVSGGDLSFLPQAMNIDNVVRDQWAVNQQIELREEQHAVTRHGRSFFAAPLDIIANLLPYVGLVDPACVANLEVLSFAFQSSFHLDTKRRLRVVFFPAHLLCRF